MRYAALRAVRFLVEHRPEFLRRARLLEAMRLLLNQEDIADFAIEDMRKFKVWELSDKVFTLVKMKSHNIRVIRRSILRYALSCPARLTKAREFINAERKKDRDYVAEIEELLKLENEETESSPRPCLKTSS